MVNRSFSTSSSIKAIPTRRSLWVHNGLGNSDESANTSESMSTDDEDSDDYWMTGHSALHKILPWVPPDGVQRRLSVLVFCCASDVGSTLFGDEAQGLSLFIDFSHGGITVAKASPTRAVDLAPLLSTMSSDACKQRFGFHMHT
jgi:hypothetical protein